MVREGCFHQKKPLLRVLPQAQIPTNPRYTLSAPEQVVRFVPSEHLNAEPHRRSTALESLKLDNVHRRSGAVEIGTGTMIAAAQPNGMTRRREKYAWSKGVDHEGHLEIRFEINCA
jgi:hypothetical protein